MLAGYPELETLEKVGTSRLFDEDYVSLARRALLFPTLDAYKKAISDRLSADYREYLHLFKIVQKSRQIIPEDQQLAVVGRRLAASIRWAYGFSESECASGIPHGLKTHADHYLWGYGVSSRFCVSDAAVLRDGYMKNFRPRGLQEVTDDAIKNIPATVLKLMFDAKGKARAIYTFNGGKIEPSEMWNAENLDRKAVEILLESAVEVPLEALLRYPDLLV